MCVNFLSCSSCSQFASLFPGLTTEEEVLKVLCILDTNTFQVEEKNILCFTSPLFYIYIVLHLLCFTSSCYEQVLAAGCASSLSGLFPRAALLNHSCSPNCRLVFRFFQLLR